MGEAFPEILARFVARAPCRVLDIGAGQGRDALAIARMGHSMVAMDSAASGLEQLAEDAAAEGLDIQTIHADLCDFEPTAPCDVLLIDRTLHMLPASQHLPALQRLLACVVGAGEVLIADEISNLPAMAKMIEANGDWQQTLYDKGFLFYRRTTPNA